MTSSLEELNALLDNFVPLTRKVNDAKTAALEKEAEALNLILSRVWLILPYLHENGEPGQCPLIDRTESVPTGDDSGFAVHNQLILLDDGPRLVRSFTVSRWGRDSPAFEIDDRKDISCLDAIKSFGFEEICAGLVDMLKSQTNIDVEHNQLQARIEKAESLCEMLRGKFVMECRASEQPKSLSPNQVDQAHR